MLEILAALLVLALMVLAAIGATYVIMAAFDAYGHNHIKFNQFKELYNADPDKWMLYIASVGFAKSIYADTLYFNFNLLDFFRYTLWRHATIKQNRQKEHNKNLQEVMSAIQLDKE